MKPVFLLVVGLLACTPAAFAQPPAIQARAAFGASNYLHSDIEYIAPAVLVAVRLGRDRFAVEPELAYAWHEDQTSFGGVTSSTSQHFRSIGVNVLARGRGRISPFFGGGLGVYMEERRTTVNGHRAELTRGPRAGTQIVGGLDVRVAPRITVFGQARFEIRSFADPGGGSVSQGFAGVAFTLR
jgi:hypothetical protein